MVQSTPPMIFDVFIVLIGAFFLAGLTAFLTRKTFFASYGPVVVDYWAFGAGIFLVSEAGWRILESREGSFGIQLCRLLRLSVGICIFTIHLLQFIRDGKLGI